MTPITVGLLDSGVDAELAPAVAAARRFVLEPGGGVKQLPAGEDSLGHGSELARLILAAAPEVRLLSAGIFERGATAPAVVAAGLEWLLDEGAVMINMSFGLRQDRRVLREGCAAALAAGAILVAAAPARGAPVYPSSYPGVLRVTGDARCAPGEFSHLATAQAEFGACPRGLTDHATGGASFAVARVTGELAALLAGGSGRTDVSEHLRGLACYTGPERRR